MARFNLRRAQADPTLVIPIYRDKHGNLFVTRDHSNVQGERITQFKDSTEMQKAMSLTHPDTGRDLYDSDVQYRAAIEEILVATDASAIGVNLERPNPAPTNEEFLKALEIDAARQRMAELVDKAGGNDAIAKFELAKAILNPTEVQRQEFTVMESLQNGRPYEALLKARKAAGMGPLQESAPMQSDEELNAYERAKEQEALDYLDSIGSDEA